MEDLDRMLPDLFREEPRERDQWMRFALWLSAIFWVILAVLFWMVPYVSGIPFLLLAVVTAAMASPRFARWVSSGVPHRRRQSLHSGLRAPRGRLRPPML